MPQGGTITIEASNRELAEGKLPGRPEIEPGPWVELSVSDTGVGMDDVTQSHVFEPFFSTKPEGLGSGLGLATVHGIVRQSAGHVVIESRTGGGSTFRVLLRPTRESAEQPAEAAPRLDRAAGGGETILLAEDEEQVRRLMTRALEEQGYVVLTAPDGERAAEIAARHEGRIELLVSDVVMPGLSGRELADWLQTRRPELRVLFVSGYAREPDTQLDPSEAYLPKPFSTDVLLHKVREVLDTAPVV
jgi:CheY-like chemotaxis protein